MIKSILIACLAANASAGLLRGRTLLDETTQCMKKCQSSNSDLGAKDWWAKSTSCNSACTASESHKLSHGKTETQLTQQIEADEVKAFVVEAAKATGLSKAQVEAAVGEKEGNAKKIMDPIAQKKIMLSLKAIKAAALAKAWHRDNSLQGFDGDEQKLIAMTATDMDSAFDSVAADLTGLTTGAVHSAMQQLTLSGSKLVAVKGLSKTTVETDTVKKLQSKLPVILSKLSAIAKESKAAATSTLSSKVQLANVLRGSQSRKLPKTMTGFTAQYTHTLFRGLQSGWRVD